MGKVLKIVIIILVIVALAVVGFSMFSEDTGSSNNTGTLQSLNTGNSVNTTSTLQTSNQSILDTEQINREFVTMLLNLDAIRLNDDIFSEAAFSVLRDNSIRLNQPGNEGRPNPFAPIGIDQLAPSANAASVGSATLQANSSSASLLSDEQIQEVFNASQGNTLTQEEATNLVLETWGGCDDNCASLAVTVQNDNGQTTVTALYNGLYDDSIASQRRVASASYMNGAWALGEPIITQTCQPGRGHSDFSAEPCI